MKHLKANDFRRPSKEECSAQSVYDLGDEVYLDFGKAGQLGPGEITGKMEFDFDGETFEAYEVGLPYDDHDDIHLGMFGVEFLEPADSSKGLPN